MLKWLLFFSLSLSGIIWMQEKFPQERLTDKIVFDFNETFANYSADTLNFTAFGYQRAVSSLLWLRFLQQTPPKKIGSNQVSWIYRDLDTITVLDPDFYPVYEQGGVFLSVITEDRIGAEKILLKGTERFPDRWRLRAYLAYHYQFEMNELQKAGEQYVAGAQLPGAPALLAIRASHFLQKKGQLQNGILLLQTMINATSDAGVKKKLQDKLDKLRRGIYGQ